MQDTTTYWYAPETGRPALKNILNNDLLSAFMHGRFWHNHRENVVVRDSLSPFHARGLRNPELKDTVLTDNEVRFQVSAATLSGGAMLLSDPVDELRRSPSRTELISQFLPHYEGKGCIALDTFKGAGQPSLYMLPVKRTFEEWIVLGVFNWQDGYEDFTAPLNSLDMDGEWHAFEFWGQEYLGIHSGSLPILDVPPHACKIVALRKPADRLQLLGTNMHLLQGAVELEHLGRENGAMEVTVGHFMQQERRLTFWRPDTKNHFNIETNATDYLVDTRKPNLLAIQFNGRKQTKFRIS